VVRLQPKELTTVDTNYSRTDINALAAVWPPDVYLLDHDD
jgi:hypothetical protein